MKLANCKFCNTEFKINKHASIKNVKCEKCHWKRRKKCVNCSIEYIGWKRTKTCNIKCAKMWRLKNKEKSNEKRMKTCLEKYGEEYPSQNEKIKEKVKKTCIKRYGWESSIKNYNKLINLQ